MKFDGRRGRPRLPSPPNMALQRTRRPRLRSGRSLCSLGSPLNALSFGGRGQPSLREVQNQHRCDLWLWQNLRPRL
jgi:hypothetical protein